MRCVSALLALASLEHSSAAQARPIAAAATEARPIAAAATEARPIDRILAHAAEDNRVQDHLRELCKTIGPRLTGTQAFDASARWARDRLASYGLDARLEEWGTFPVGFERGVSRGGMVAPEAIEYTFITSAWSAGTHGPRRGRALLEPTSEAELAAAKDALAGAWIVRGGARASGEVLNAVRRALDEADVSGYVRAGGRNGLLVMGGDHRVDLQKPPRDVEIRLHFEQHEDLVKRLKDGQAVELDFDVGNQFTPGPVPCANVIADLRGREFPDEYVIVGGHLDSWDAAEGAQDNGTGVATTIEAARLVSLAGAPPRRTIRFVLFGGEEQGLLGSSGYVQAHGHELAKTSLALIHDGGGTHLGGLATTYAMLDDFRAVFAPLEGVDPARPFRIEESAGVENSGDSDHAPFIAAGVPGFFWRQTEEGYTRVHHTQHDVFEEVDPAEQRHSARVAAVAAWGFAELPRLLDRTDMKPVSRRRMSVQLDGTTVQGVTTGGKAAAAGFKTGDVILSVDGEDVSSRDHVTELLQRGTGRKAIRLKRGDEVVLAVLDWSDDKAEPERAARAERRDAWRRAHAER